MPPVRLKNYKSQTLLCSMGDDVSASASDGSSHMSVGMSRSSSDHSTSTSRASTPDTTTLEDTVRRSLGLAKVAVARIELLSRHLHRLYCLHLSNNRTVILKCAPSPRVRLLRVEQHTVEIEGRTLDLIAKHTSIAVPQLIKYEPNKCVIGSAFLLLSHAEGIPLSRIASNLSRADRTKIDFSLGSHLKALASLTAPTFGCAMKVARGQGHHSWKEAFAYIMEALLRDADDALINIPFDFIRHVVGKHGHLLDDIHEARLIRFNAADERNIFVDGKTLDITGIVGWSNVFWGDPMMADVFCNDPSDAILEGYGRDADAGERGQKRQLLYTVFHALTVVVMEAYRPTSDHAELDGRRRLTSVLNKLANMG